MFFGRSHRKKLPEDKLRHGDRLTALELRSARIRYPGEDALLREGKRTEIRLP
jgi:hypothetical protein